MAYLLNVKTVRKTGGLILTKPIMGQPCLCPDGLGRVCGSWRDYIRVKDYINGRESSWPTEDVKLKPMDWIDGESIRLKPDSSKIKVGRVSLPKDLLDHLILNLDIFLFKSKVVDGWDECHDALIKIKGIIND